MACRPEVGQWGSCGALFGGPDGTRVIAEVLAGLGEAGIGAPVIGLEIGQGQGSWWPGWSAMRAGQTEIRLDLAGIDGSWSVVAAEPVRATGLTARPALSPRAIPA